MEHVSQHPLAQSPFTNHPLLGSFFSNFTHHDPHNNYSLPSGPCKSTAIRSFPSYLTLVLLFLVHPSIFFTTLSILDSSEHLTQHSLGLVIASPSHPSSPQTHPSILPFTHSIPFQTLHFSPYFTLSLSPFTSIIPSPTHHSSPQAYPYILPSTPIIPSQTRHFLPYSTLSLPSFTSIIPSPDLHFTPPRHRPHSFPSPAGTHRRSLGFFWAWNDVIFFPSGRPSHSFRSRGSGTQWLARGRSCLTPQVASTKHTHEGTQEGARVWCGAGKEWKEKEREKNSFLSPDWFSRWRPSCVCFSSIFTWIYFYLSFFLFFCIGSFRMLLSDSDFFVGSPQFSSSHLFILLHLSLILFSILLFLLVRVLPSSIIYVLCHSPPTLTPVHHPLSDFSSSSSILSLIILVLNLPLFTL